MKNSISQILVAIVVLLSFNPTNAQIKNAKTESVKIYGNCGMCEKTIEKAGNLKKVAEVNWDKDTKMATLTYDAQKTCKDEILKRIALAGYDSDTFLAPEDVYANLHGCCQYERSPLAPKGGMVGMQKDEKSSLSQKDHDMNHGSHASPEKMKSTDSNQLKSVFAQYFELKDALVSTDAVLASEKSTALLSTIQVVKMNELAMDVHTVWMNVLTDLNDDAKKIAAAKDVEKQRNYFMSLSKNMYALMKITQTEAPVYYQFCPMANDGKGANWLSTESTIKNPYYGSMMLGCGKTVETIK